MSTLQRADEAYAEQDWGHAYAHFRAADAEAPLDPEHLERLAITAQCLGKGDDSVEAWSRAHAAHLSDGNLERAAMAAAWCSFVLLTRGEFALGSGWLARAQALCDENNLD